MSAASFEYRGHTIEVRRASLISSETSLVINGETQAVISGIIKSTMKDKHLKGEILDGRDKGCFCPKPRNCKTLSS